MATQFAGFDKNNKKVKTGATIVGDTNGEKQLIASMKNDDRVVKITKDDKEIWKK